MEQVERLAHCHALADLAIAGFSFRHRPMPFTA